MVTTNGRISYNDDDQLTPADIAAYLKISAPTARKLIRSGEITGGMIGTHFRAYFKYVREYEESRLKGGILQQGLPLRKPEEGAEKKKSPKTRKA